MERTLEILRRLLIDGLICQTYRHARRAYPDECCGMILRTGLRECTNIQDALHHQNPMAHPRTARKAFSFTADDSIFLAQSQRTDDPVLAVYHSHPNETANFSRADRDAALCDGKPVYPSLLHLVIACAADRIDESRLFGLVDGAHREVAHFDGAPI
jgi:adenylyltransferase/sulfurtransferase